MPTPARRLLTAALLAALIGPAGAVMASAVSAHAEPLPEPEPIPVPEQGVSEPSVSVSADGETRVSAPAVGAAGSSGTSSYLDPVHVVPNLNGDPCTGAWESTACYAMNFDSAPAVAPRSSISSSP